MLSRRSTYLILIALALLVAICTTDSGSWTTYTSEDGLACDEVLVVGVASDGTVWAGGPCDISRFDGQSWSTLDPDPDGSWGEYVISFAEAPDSSLWFGTLAKGVFRFDGETWTQYLPADYGVTGDTVGSIAVTPNGTVWAGIHCFSSRRYGCGAARFDGESWTHHRVEYDYTPPFGSGSGNSVKSIAVGPDGAVWFGGWGGIARFDGETWTTYTQEDGLPYSNITSIAVAPDGSF